MTPEPQEQKIIRYTGCMLSAVLGDALAMPYESVSAHTPKPLAFATPYRGHPNEGLRPGQYTDDGQIILISARILAESKTGFNTGTYAEELLRTHKLNKFRYADGAVIAACKNMERSKNLLKSGILADTAGCLGLAVPFALAFSDRKEMANALMETCRITHTGSGAVAGTVGTALLLNTLLETGDMDKAWTALDSAAEHMYPELSVRLNSAYRAANNKIPPQTAALHIGSTSHILHVLPLTAYFSRAFTSPEEMLKAIVSCGGNCGPVATICGAICGARYGTSALPGNLISSVERAGIFENLAKTLYFRAYPETEKRE